MLTSSPAHSGREPRRSVLVLPIVKVSSAPRSRFGDKVDIRLIQPKRSLLGFSAGSGVTASLAEKSVDTLIDTLIEIARSRFGL